MAMKLPYFIAKRYLFSKRKKNFINIISIIAISLVGAITAALIIVLSVFNGLEDLLRGINDAFDPQIKIEATKGKSFASTPELMKSIESVPGVQIVTEVIEDYAYVRYRDANQVITLKGVSQNFLEQHRIDNSIVQGKLLLSKNDVNYALIGRGVQYTLSVDLSENLHPLHIYYIKSLRAGTLDPTKLYSQRSIMPSGVFSIVQNFDDNYVLVPLEFAKDLLNYGDKRTSLEIKVAPDSNPLVVQQNLKKLLGEKFNVLNHEEQHKDLYRLLKIEKVFAFTAGLLLLCIGSINIYFSLMMLALDKKKDVSILSAMGAQSAVIKNIFLIEGAFIALFGTAIGLVIGGTLCWLQDSYSLISMGMESSVTEGYPVKIILSDFLYILIVMVIITFTISYRPATLASRFASVHNL